MTTAKSPSDESSGGRGNPTFIQQSRLGRKSMELFEDRIEVTFGPKRRAMTSIVWLSEISPKVERIRYRNYSLVTIPAGIGAFCIMLAKALLDHTTFSWTVIVPLPAYIVLLSIVQVVKGIPLVEIVRFRNQFGVPVLDLIKEKQQAHELEAFVGLVLSRSKERGIKNIKSM
jgi:hypothetical protein